MLLNDFNTFNNNFTELTRVEPEYRVGYASRNGPDGPNGPNRPTQQLSSNDIRNSPNLQSSIKLATESLALVYSMYKSFENLRNKYTITDIKYNQIIDDLKQLFDNCGYDFSAYDESNINKLNKSLFDQEMGKQYPSQSVADRIYYKFYKKFTQENRIYLLNSLSTAI